MNEIRWCRWILAVSALMTPFLLVLIANLQSDTDNISNWLPQNTSDRLEYDQFVELFGQDDELLVSWPGCTVDDPRLDELVQRLQHRNRTERLFDSIVSGKAVLDDLSKAKYSLSESQLKRRLRGVFFDGQYETTSVVLQLSDLGKSQGFKCVEVLNAEIQAVEGLTCDEVKIAGDAFTTVQIDRATQETLLYSLPAILFAVIFTYFCVGSLRLLLASFVAAGSAALLAVAFVTFCGGRFNSMLVMMPVLIIVLTFSSTIHLASYYKRAIWDGAEWPVRQMLHCGLRPCLLSVVTTMIGVGMLCISSVPAVRSFGFYSAAGLSFSLFSILVLYPAILMVWKSDKSDIKIPDEKNGLDFYLRISNRSLLTIANFIVLGFFTAVPFLVFGLGRIESRLQPERMFPADNPVVNNIEWLQKKFSTVRSIDVVVSYDIPFVDANVVDQLYELRKIQAKLAKLDAVKS
ncbi:MAG: MMPL family transporter, partial [Planctomycetota bacterium]